MDESRVVARRVAETAQGVLPVCEDAHPDDARPRAADDAAGEFVGGAPRTGLRRITSADAHRAARGGPPRSPRVSPRTRPAMPRPPPLRTRSRRPTRWATSSAQPRTRPASRRSPRAGTPRQGGGRSRRSAREPHRHWSTSLCGTPARPAARAAPRGS
ncbi:putative immunity protein [Streptomyces tremellae]|uniref:putative immunity protein n=1 Tax=Streptomyces tremellae TaxID=1124239 RepID=UPI0031E60283